MAYWHEESSKRVSPRSVCALPTDLRQRIRDKGQKSAGGRGLAHWRTPRVQERRNTISPTARRDEPAHSGCHIKARWICEQAHQQMEEELGLRSLRGPILAQPSLTRAHDNDRLRLPSAPHSSEGRGKESTDRHLSQACRPCVTPSTSTASCDRFSDARTAEKVSAQDCCIN